MVRMHPTAILLTGKTLALRKVNLLPAARALVALPDDRDTLPASDPGKGAGAWIQFTGSAGTCAMRVAAIAAKDAGVRSGSSSGNA